jgi:hypothetical protein
MLLGLRALTAGLAIAYAVMYFRAHTSRVISGIAELAYSMTAIFVAWAASAVVLVAIALTLGLLLHPSRTPLGILIDQRGRFSLTSFQLVMWSIIILSLISGAFWGRLVHDVADPLSFSIPGNVLGLIGISAGSAATASAIKAGKDLTRAPSIAASSSALDPPRFSQIFMLEEGSSADEVIDVTKYQNFVITIVLGVAYVALAAHAVHDAGSASAFKGLPDFSGTFLVLLGISHGTYVAGKLPNQAGTPRGLTLEHLELGTPAAFVARNARAAPPPPTRGRATPRSRQRPRSER